MGVRGGELAGALAPAIASTAVMAIAVMAVRGVLPLVPASVELAVLAAVGAVAYLAALLVFARRAVGEIIAFLLRRELAPA
jgi:hypothetical protein